jgi:hypothetical protein
VQPYRAVPFPRSGTKVPETGNAAPYMIPVTVATTHASRRRPEATARSLHSLEPVDRNGMKRASAGRPVDQIATIRRRPDEAS